MPASIEDGAPLTEMADKALQNYDIEVVSKQLIRHNENLTWRINSRAGTSFVLRIHMPKYEGFIGLQQPIACTLLTWVDGEVFSQDDPNAMELTFKMGALQQALHTHSQEWVPPAGFKRLVYDETTIVQTCEDFGKGKQSGIVGALHYFGSGIAAN